MSKLAWSLPQDRNEFDPGGSGACPGVWHGREALYFENKLAAPVLLRDEFGFDRFRLQAEIACPGPVAFIGLVFGARDADNYELVYVSPASKDDPGEIQYDPFMNGSSTWQIYNGPRYQAPAPFAPGEWTRLALDVQPHSVSISVGETGEPQLVIPNLQHGRCTGRIGVWGYLPGYIRNLSVEEIQEAPPVSLHGTETDSDKLSADGFVTEWTASEPYSRDGHPIPGRKGRVAVEENGTLNLNRLYESKAGTTVQAECRFMLPGERETVLSFGYSDHIRLWVNEEEVYEGAWKWGPPESDGRIRPDHAAVPVRWKAGLNTIRAEVTSEEVMFGWGLCVKTGLPGLSFLPDEDGYPARA
jgi:hypothetical protein